ncbi:hypothetical protein MSAN_02160100 [Mycena sanguinolenta]|uniref:Uncharacterized protein n=1 Tax=Mycena sanguinolenta TaxID=230812 RepID=A0A8H6XE64_9AGAR|nr:hypothetical protein MSAN_02160100 [Mycena sanguinolenta]
MAGTLAWLCLLSVFATVNAALHRWDAPNFCKCVCFGVNSTILPLTRPDNPAQPCLSCTKHWCLDQNLPKCFGAKLGDTDPDTASGKEGDVEARCFQRDSPRDQLVVTLFLLTVFGLLLGAGVKNRMAKAGLTDTHMPWDAGRRWWDSWQPGTQIGLSRFGRRANGNEMSMGEYAPVAPEPERLG